MGCASSKRVEARVDVYRPAPTSFSVFDINAIQEPWVKVDDIDQEQQQEKLPSHVPEPLLQKLKAIDDVPRSWDEVSKALEDLKPTLHSHTSPAPDSNPQKATVETQAQDSVVPTERVPRKSFSFHTLEELEAKLSTKPTELKKTESLTDMNKLDSAKPELRKFVLSKTESLAGIAPGTESRAMVVTETESGRSKPVSENIFLVKDRLEKQKQGKDATFVKRDPLSDYPDICPPGGVDSVVLYTTSLGGVRRTFEDCNRVRSILELHQIVFDERDISLHGEFLHELKDLLGDGVSVPRMFVKGKYVGGVEEIVNLNETGRLRKIMSWARVERGVGRQGCMGCGGARFVPCLACGGSCKVTVGDKKEKCEKCNENGLIHCPACA